MDQTQILVATNGEMAQIRVTGRATHACSHGLREFAMGQLAHGVKRFVLDLSACESMDSTFMGVLSMIAIRGRAKQVPVAIVNASAHTEKLLHGLGIKKLFCFAKLDSPNPDWQSLSQACPSALADCGGQQRTVLEAHETLMAVDPANVPRFEDVVSFLKQDLRSKGD